MSPRRQAFFAIFLGLFGASNAFGAPAMRLISVPEKIAGAGACVNGAMARVFFEATGGESIDCRYVKNGSVFEFVRCRGGHVNAGDLVVADTVGANAPTTHTGGFFARLFGHRDEHDCDRDRDDDRDDDDRRTPACASDADFQSALTSLVENSHAACGGLADADTHFLGNVSCPNAGWAALQFSAQGKTLHGRGHSLIAPKVSLALFAMGDGLTIRDLKQSGTPNGTGLQAYNTDHLVVRDSSFRGNSVGLNVYTDAMDPQAIAIVHNDLSNNAYIGLKFNGDNGHRAANPYLAKNDISNAGYYGLWLDVSRAQLDGNWGNKFDGDNAGLMFRGGDFVVANLDLSRAGITNNEVFFNGAHSAVLVNSNLSYNAPANSMQQRVAVHFYRTLSVSVNGLAVTSGDVGVKVATDGGVIPASVVIANSRLVNETMAGIMFQSYDGTSLGGGIRVLSDDLRGDAFNGGAAIWWVPGTPMPAGTVIRNVLQ
jgi:hypothetical protein